MAFMEKLIGTKKEDFDVEEFLNRMDTEQEDPYEDADAFVKPITLSTDQDKDMVLEEAKKGNIILVNIGDLSKRNGQKLKELINAIRAGVETINGDIARISQEKVIVTPSRVKIIKKRE